MRTALQTLPLALTFAAGVAALVVLLRPWLSPERAPVAFPDRRELVAVDIVTGAVRPLEVAPDAALCAVMSRHTAWPPLHALQTWERLECREQISRK